MDSQSSKSSEYIYNFVLFFLYQYLYEANIEKYSNYFDDSDCLFMRKLNVNSINFKFPLKNTNSSQKQIIQSNKSAKYKEEEPTKIVFNNEILPLMKKESSSLEDDQVFLMKL